MSERFSTAGMYLMYAVETTAGTRPETGYIKIPEVKAMPSFNPAPEAIESTTLEETEYKTYVQGLKDPGGSLEYTANLTEDLIEEWDKLMSAYNTAVASNKQVWFAVVHRHLTQATYYQGTPAPIGLNEAAVSSMLETTLYITPNSAPIMAERPTDFVAPVAVGYSLGGSPSVGV